MRGLYAIIDVTSLAALSLPIVEVAKAVAEARPAAMQLRAKDASARETLTLLRAIHPFCLRASVPLFANDRVDLALAAGCEGVHVGQTDLPIEVVRKIAPHLRIGVSTHDVSQVDEAIESRPDYLAFGPVYATKSKANPDPVVGREALADIVRRSPLPVVAIGGIDAERAREIGEVCPVAAVIGALIPDGIGPGDMKEVTKRSRELHQALLGGSIFRAGP